MNRRSDRTVSGPVSPPAGYEDLVERIQAFPRERTWLLPALLTIQEDLGWLPDWSIELAAAHLRVPKSEAYGAASSFPELRLTEPPATLVRICTGSACRLAGASALPGAVPTAETADCLFICALAPAAAVDGRLIGHATPEGLRA